MLNKLNLTTLTLALTLFLTSPSIALAGFGVSPAQIIFEYLKPGSQVTQQIVLSRSETDEELTITIEPELEEANSWLKFDPGSKFVMPKGEFRHPVVVTITVPAGAPLKNYNGSLKIKTISLSEEQNAAGVSIVKGARMEVKLVTTKINVNDLTVRSLKLYDATNDQNGQALLTLTAAIENTGNVAAAPSKATIEIQDLLKQPVITADNFTPFDKIDPSTVKDVQTSFKVKIPSGEYYGLVNVYLNDKLLRSERLVFRIHPAPATDRQSSVQKTSFLNKLTPAAKTAVAMIPVIITVLAVSAYLIIKTAFNRLLIIIISVAALISSFFGLRLLVAAKPAPPSASSAVLSPTPQPTGEVKGEQTQNSDPVKPKFSPLQVTQNGPVEYHIYRLPDLDSQVASVAFEDQQFFVLEESANWYRVTLPDGTDGWLPKSNIKTTTTEEQ